MAKLLVSRHIFLPLKTADIFVLEYRKWLDKFGSEMPFYEGYTTSKRPKHPPEITLPLDRYSRHIQLCSSCKQAHKNTISIKQTSILMAIILVAIAILTHSEPLKISTVIGALIALTCTLIAKKLKTHLENPYLR